MTDITLCVEQGGELPRIGKPMFVQSPITERWYEIVPKKILGLQWNSGGSLEVEMLVTKRAMDEEAEMKYGE